jgi:hypothetical protein
MEKINELKALPIPEKMIFEMQKNVLSVIKLKKEIDKAIYPELSKVSNE